MAALRKRIEPYYSDDLITIYLGDAREILPQLGKVDMIFVDPPYGHNNNDGDLIHRMEVALGKTKKAHESRPIANDGPEANELVRWMFAEVKKHLAHGGCCCCCCCGGGGPDPQFARWSLWLDEVMSFRQMIVWDKGWGLGWHYRRCYEVILVASRDRLSCKWHDTTKAIKNIIRFGEVTRVIAGSPDVSHPTPKPPELAQWFIRLHTLPGETVLDPFAGAGSTLIAARRMKRKAIGIEIDKRW